MKKKQLIFLVVATIVVLVVGMLVSSSRQRAWEQSGSESDRLVLPGFDGKVNDVAKIGITDTDGAVSIVKQEGRWRVAERYNYPANYDTVFDFLRDLTELKAAQTLNVGASQYGRLQLLAPGGDEQDAEKLGTCVVLAGEGDAAVAELVLGKEHERKSDASPQFGGGSWPDGRYLLVPETKKISLVSKTFSSIEAKPKNWLDKDFFKISDLKTGTLEKDGKEVWRIEREKKGDDPKLVGLGADEEQDDSDVRSLSSAFSWASFEDVADPALPDEETGMDSPSTFTATDFDGFTYVVKVGKKTSDDKFHMSVQATFDGPRERGAEEGESEEDKTKKDEEFKEKLAEHDKKAAELKERLLRPDGTPWVYLVSKYTGEKVLKERKDLIKEEEKKDEDEADAAKADAAAADTTEAKKPAAMTEEASPAAKAPEPEPKTPPAEKTAEDNAE